MLRGGCLCGGIRYEISGALDRAAYCHCGQCRKASGSSFAANASVARDDLRLVSGSELLAAYESSPGVERCFCSRCGSPLLKRAAARPGEIRLRLGSLDDDPGLRVAADIFVGSKAPWTAIADGLPQERGDEPPFGEEIS